MFRENSIETSILSRVKQTTNPRWMHETSAQGWCTGMTQRDGMGREVGGGFRMGNTYKSMADSCQCMAKPLKYCKVISLQLIQMNGGKKKEGLISPCYSLELCIQLGTSFPFSLPFAFLCSAICKASSDDHFAFLHFFFFGMVGHYLM